MALENVTLESVAGGVVTLPGLMWIGPTPSWPVSSNKQLDESTMSDGSKRFSFLPIKREWGITLGYLTKAQLDIMTTLNSYNEVLKFVNPNEDLTEYNVVMSAFSHRPERMDLRQLERYRVDITLRQA